MYEVFDSFLKRETWPTCHFTDMRQFFLALSEVVEREDFSYSAMASYLRADVAVRHPNWDKEYCEHAVSKYESSACDVYDFLKARQELRARRLVMEMEE